MMLLNGDEVPTTVKDIPVWSPRFLRECEDILSSFGFTTDSTKDGILILSPDDEDWRIERSRSTPFGYLIPDKPRMYNPKFILSFRNRRIAVIRVTVFRANTSYDAEWSHEILRSIPAVRMINQIRVIPSDLHGLIEEYLLGP